MARSKPLDGTAIVVPFTLLPFCWLPAGLVVGDGCVWAGLVVEAGGEGVTGSVGGAGGVSDVVVVVVLLSSDGGPLR